MAPLTGANCSRTGRQGQRCRPQRSSHATPHRIVNAIGRFRREYDRNLRMEHRGRRSGDERLQLSPPLQGRHRIESAPISEARMLQEALAPAQRATGRRQHRLPVGYDDASHFSREYKRLFGLPPMQDVARLRTAGPDTGGAHGISL
ncbi:MAG: hypothetical protein R2851_03925 [Caldilineaceae bacterium]